MQLIAILQLFIVIRSKSSRRVSIDIIKGDSITREKNPHFKYFYEPQANTTVEVNKTWLHSRPTYTINNDSLNETLNYEPIKKKDIFRIIALGDSFTFGENVSTEDNWTELLERHLNNMRVCPSISKYEVINLGMKGYDAAYELERYRIRGQKYNPDLIIWYITDFYRMTEEINKYYQKLKINNTEERRLADEGVFVGKWELAYNAVIKTYGHKDNETYQINKYKSLRNFYEKDKPLLIVYSEDLSSTSNKDIIPSLSNELKGNNNYYLEMDPFNRNTDFFLDHHINKEGHQKLMLALFTYLESKKILPCPLQEETN